MNNIVLHHITVEGGKKTIKEIIPGLDSSYPQSLQIDASGVISFKKLESPEPVPQQEIPDYSPKIKIVQETTKDMFEIIAEQQERINELTDKLNSVIKFLK